MLYICTAVLLQGKSYKSDITDMLLPDVLMDKKNATNGLWINIKHIWKQVNLCKIKEVKCHIYLKTVFGRTKRLLKVY